MKKYIIAAAVFLWVILLSACGREIKIYEEEKQSFFEETEALTESASSAVPAPSASFVNPGSNNGEYIIMCGCDIDSRYEYDEEINENKIYFVNTYKNKVHSQFSDYDIIRLNNQNEPFAESEEGLYAVINKNEAVLLDSRGEIKKSFYKGSEIKDFSLDYPFIWVYDKNMIKRVDISGNKTEDIYKDTNRDDFFCFLDPVSENEVQWLEFSEGILEKADSEGINLKESRHEGDSFYHFSMDNCNETLYRAYYYNISDKKTITRDIAFMNDTKDIGRLWWRVPENAFEIFSRYKISLPGNTTKNPFSGYDIFAGPCGFLEKDGKISGFTALSFDVNEEYPAGTKGRFYTAEAGDREYYFGFYKDSSGGVFILAVDTEYYSEEEFINTYKSIQKD